jgi:hypothetical protein
MISLGELFGAYTEKVSAEFFDRVKKLCPFSKIFFCDDTAFKYQRFFQDNLITLHNILAGKFVPWVF